VAVCSAPARVPQHRVGIHGHQATWNRRSGLVTLQRGSDTYGARSLIPSRNRRQGNTGVTNARDAVRLSRFLIRDEEKQLSVVETRPADGQVAATMVAV